MPRAKAAVHGMGIALMPRLLVEDDLRRGVLIQADAHESPSDRSYYLIFPTRKSDHAALSAFRAWVEEQVGMYA
jgi:DNA-binding transcriptional LysR family regulator